jgi:CheY-like chemotaxis protein
VRVLVCDDHDLIRGMVARLLRDDGHEVTETAGAAEALAALVAERHDAVVLDLHLRGESGLAVVGGVRADPALAPTPIILLSGDFADPGAKEAARFGVEAVLPKPFEPDLLMDALARVTTAGA